LKPYSLVTLLGAFANTVFFLMKIRINGEDREIAAGLNLGGLLESLQIRPGRVVVERNREIVPRDSFGSTLLNEGDVVEIVHFVGGG
jgi:thiazole synthase/sulfur carrier protein